MTPETKKRIEEEAWQYFIDEFKGGYPIDEQDNIVAAYIAGATAEHEKLIKEIESYRQIINYLEKEINK